MNKLDKLLRKCSTKERRRLEGIIRLLLSKDRASLNITKLKGVDNLYRAKRGNFRVIYTYDENGQIELIDASRRSDTTYDFI